MSPNDNEAVAKPESFIICDANVVIQMAIFNATIMFDKASYSFGKIQVHSITVQELQRWLKPKSRKLEKFGKDIIEIAIKKSNAAGFELSELDVDERARKFKTYQLLEEKLSNEKRSADTSEEDKLILALAEKNKSFLATQEETLRNLAFTVIPQRVLSFEDLVADLFTHKQLTEKDIEEGLRSLDYFKEKLRHDQKQKILSLLSK